MRDAPDPSEVGSDPDFEVRASRSASSVRRRHEAVVRKATLGDIDRSDELSEVPPGGPKGRRWGLRAWLRDPNGGS